MKFNIIYQQILNKILQKDTFNYKFILDTDKNILKCKFESIDKETNQLIYITATINNNDITFKVFSKDKEKIKTYTDKEFLMAYNKEYINFKNAYKTYKNTPDFFKKQKKDNQIQDDKSVKIDTLDEVLQEEENKINGYSIKFNNIYYTFTNQSTETISNIIICKFQVKNDATFKSENDLDYYNVLATIKMTPINSKIIKFDLFDPNKTQADKPVATLKQTQFKQKFKSDYYDLQAVLAIYEKHYEKQIDKGLF